MFGKDKANRKGVEASANVAENLDREESININNMPT